MHIPSYLGEKKGYYIFKRIKIVFKLVTEFMEALSDPRAFLSNQEKRAAQLKAIGIDESDISTAGIIVSGTPGLSEGGGGSGGGDGGGGGLGQVPSTGRAAGSTGKSASSGSGGGPSLPTMPGLPGVAAKRPEREKEDVKFEALTADTLKQKKTYLKVTKKHAKDLDTMRKKQEKERAIMQKTQVTTLDKLMKSLAK